MPRCPLPDDATVDLWRIRLDARQDVSRLRGVLSVEERARADRFIRAEHGARFIVAHGWKRRILAAYLGGAAEGLAFAAGVHGKPALVRLGADGAAASGLPGREAGGYGDEHAARPAAGLEFNLSHSGELALLAVTGTTAVGVDVERWDANVEHLALAERFFSPAERTTLRALVDRAPPHARHEQTIAGFFAAWSRKEAYLKATGVGITRGLHYFDVSLDPGEPARLIADRHDVHATSRWRMHAPHVESGYSAAVVSATTVSNVRVLDTDALG